MEAFGYIASLVMGVVLGLIGGGGSILTVPIMVYLFNLSPVAATGYSLFVVGLTALIGSAMYIRKGEIHIATGLAFALPSIVGVNLSRAFILPGIPETFGSLAGLVLTKEILVMVTFAALMIAASTSMIRKRTGGKEFQGHAAARLALVLSVGFCVGLIAGFVGAGGGFLIIPALVMLTGLPMRTAVGTSLFIIALQSLTGFGGDWIRGVTVDWPFVGGVAAIAVIGIVAGSALAHRVREQKLKEGFGWFVLVIGAAILVEQIHRLSLR